MSEALGRELGSLNEAAMQKGAALSNREVAGALDLAESTITQHLRRAFRKLGVRSRQELTRAALLDTTRPWDVAR